MVTSRIRHLRAVHSDTRPWGGPAGWRKPGALPSCGEGPVFDDQARVALEVGLVVSDQCGLDANGVGRNEAVEGILSALWNGGTRPAMGAQAPTQSFLVRTDVVRRFGIAGGEMGQRRLGSLLSHVALGFDGGFQPGAQGLGLRQIRDDLTARRRAEACMPHALCLERKCVTANDVSTLCAQSAPDGRAHALGPSRRAGIRSVGRE